MSISLDLRLSQTQLITMADCGAPWDLVPGGGVGKWNWIKKDGEESKERRR